MKPINETSYAVQLV